jgi:hypothetical protein
MNLKTIAIAVAFTALAGLGIYLGGSSTSGSGDDRRATSSAGAVAKVNGYTLSADYVQSRIEQLPLGSQIDVRENKNQFIETLVTEEALFQSVLRQGLESDPALRDKVKSVVAEHLIETQVRAKIAVTPRDIEDYYQNNQQVIRGETVQVRHILLAQRAECDALLPSIDSLATFEALAAEHSLDKETGARGGVLGRVMNHNAWLGFEQQMFQMKEGELRVFDGPTGCHVVRAGARDIPSLPPLAAVSERIQSLIARQREIDLLQALIARIESQLPIERNYSK